LRKSDVADGVHLGITTGGAGETQVRRRPSWLLEGENKILLPARGVLRSSAGPKMKYSLVLGLVAEGFL